MLSQNIVNILEAKGVLSLQRYDDVSRRQFEMAHGIFFYQITIIFANRMVTNRKNSYWHYAMKLCVTEVHLQLSKCLLNLK